MFITDTHRHYILKGNSIWVFSIYVFVYDMPFNKMINWLHSYKGSKKESLIPIPHLLIITVSERYSALVISLLMTRQFVLISCWSCSNYTRLIVAFWHALIYFLQIESFLPSAWNHFQIKGWNWGFGFFPTSLFLLPSTLFLTFNSSLSFLTSFFQFLFFFSLIFLLSCSCCISLASFLHFYVGMSM